MRKKFIEGNKTIVTLIWVTVRTSFGTTALIPGRTDPRISPRRPISIKFISHAAWANHGNCQCAGKVQSQSC